MNNEKIIEIQNEARAIFNLLQQLHAPLSENNIAVLNACMSSLKLIGKICKESKEETNEEPEEEVSE